MTPSGLCASPGGRGRRCLLCAPLRGARDPPAARDPLAAPGPSSGRPGPLLGPACQLGARWFAPRGAGRSGEAGSPLPRPAPEPAGRGDARRPSCGPDCSWRRPASRCCCRGPRPAATPGGSRPGTWRRRDASWAPTSASRGSGVAAAQAGHPPWAVGTASFPSAPLAAGVASASLPTSAPARMERKGPPAQMPTGPAGNTAATWPVTMAAARRWPECAPWASP